MERLLIFLAVLILVTAGALVVAMASRGRRPPLRMDSEFHDDDTDILTRPVSRRTSPIDRSADVIDVTPHEAADGGARETRPRGGPAPGDGR
jgi:hypothetical protein